MADDPLNAPDAAGETELPAVKPKAVRRQRAKAAQGDQPEGLEPAQQLPHVLLPPQDQVASANPSASDTITKRFDQGIEFADQVGEIAGYLSTIGIPALALFTFLGIEEVSALLTVLSVAMGWVCLLMIRLDFQGQKYDPVLFDRATQQVHVMEPALLWWWELLFIPWRIASKPDIRTFDWACARAEVVHLTMVQGLVARTEYNLMLAFTETPGSNKVVYRSAVGTSTAYEAGQACVARWEHIRRYMRDDGPSLRAGDRPWVPAAPTFWRGFFYGQMLLGPGSGEFWKSRDTWVYVMGTLSLFILPFTIFHGLVRWACWAVRPSPKWPAEIQRSVGPALSADDMQRVARGELTVS